jgi:hypothetical protein
MCRFNSFYRKSLTALALFSVLSISVNGFSTPEVTAAQDDFLASTQVRLLIATDAQHTVASATDYMKNWEALPGPIKSKTSVALSAAELRQLQTLTDALKGNLRSLQSSLAGLTQKLKSNGKFTPQLDSYVTSYLRAKGGSAVQVANYIEQQNNVRGLLDSANQLISAQSTRIDDLVSAARDGGSRRAHAPAAPVKFACTAHSFKVVAKVLRGTDTPQDFDDFKEDCSK